MFFKKRFLMILMLSVLLLLLVISPEICTVGAHKGILISGNIIIPSLFPVTVIVLMITKYDLPVINDKITKSIFGQSSEMFFAMIMSMLGGYPMGAKIIDEMVMQGKISDKQANFMLMYCVNAGPAFLIIAIGNGILNSRKLGYILYFSHIIASLIIAICVSVFYKEKTATHTEKTNIYKHKFSNIFVISTAQAAKSVLGVCSFVILFSVINSYLEYFSLQAPIFNYLLLFTEVTCAVSKTDNIILISFLLGFSGLSIWFQIFSLLKNIKANLKMFILGRVLHGSLSCISTLLLLKIFDVTQITFSNNIDFSSVLVYDNFSLAVSLLIMIILFIIYLHAKNHSGKILKDVI